MMDGQLLTLKLCAGNLAIVHKVCIFQSARLLNLKVMEYFLLINIHEKFGSIIFTTGISYKSTVNEYILSTHHTLFLYRYTASTTIALIMVSKCIIKT